MTRPPHQHVEVRSAYADSVALLQVSRTVAALPGVAAAQVAMATPLNLDVLAGMGFEVPDDAGPNDMVVALRLVDGDPTTLEAAVAGVDAALRALRSARPAAAGAQAPPRTTASALRGADPGDPVLVSVPGASAAVEAADALAAGHDVMIFSDNVPLEHEVALKRAAAERGLLVMGPDCGTAVLDGVGLGFANVTRPGPVGVVAASGTGCQQLLALLDHAGVGVSWALGVGGRDLGRAVGGLATREALRRLDADPGVERIVLVSKPPDDEVAAALASYAATLGTPVQLALLGPGLPDLTAVAEQVLADLGVPVPQWPVAGEVHREVRGELLVGLFAGGTLAQETELLCRQAGVPHEVVDLGDDELTHGRAHPMIDPTLRLERLVGALEHPHTGVVQVDVVLGHGADPDPAATLVPALAEAARPVVVSLVGTAADPQDLLAQRTALARVAEVHLSNAGATRRAIGLLTGGAR
ncbi:FdrA protein [Nocardioides marinisabuli]|uniref:FdrA protein n=1 Tax=Nocardioides marinisabuli TaxID=419476 RepID=A0A7Y9EXR9_9ACTN|nr:FdrA family protein [Nocardioides marinisabuli]NYD55918.1 FdrA protein [Nocardioides marinisabuli]